MTIDTRCDNNSSDALALHFRRYAGGGDSDDGGHGNGDSPALLILHGLFGSGGNWRSIAARLSATREVYCLDLRNHGRSPWHARMGYDAMARDVARFITERRLRAPAVLGHSMGGKTALTLAQNHPDLLGKLIVLDIAPLPYPRARHLALIDAMLAADLTASRQQIESALVRQIPDPATRQFLTQNLTQSAAGNAYRWRLNLPAIRHNLPALAGYDNSRPANHPTLFIAAAHSDYLPATAHPAIHAKFPNAQIQTIPNAGHWVHTEQPARLVEMVEGFIRG